MAITAIYTYTLVCILAHLPDGCNYGSGSGEHNRQDDGAHALGNAGEEIADTIAEIEEFCGKWGADFRQSYYVTLTVEELCMAIIQNAFGKGREDYIQLTLIAQENGEFTLHIRDSAVSFNPFSMKMKKLELGDDNTEEEMKSVGILIVVKNAKEFFYRRYQGFNTLTVKV